ncbi:hypothetical protein [Streptomyces sp. NPDC006552]|uniref:hypothetical protein n=1 Tax=Streptomyces sp. NPDC006552 TaxID=3157179 RepID=UPI0033A7762F
MYVACPAPSGVRSRCHPLLRCHSSRQEGPGGAVVALAAHQEHRPARALGGDRREVSLALVVLYVREDAVEVGRGGDAPVVVAGLDSGEPSCGLTERADRRGPQPPVGKGAPHRVEDAPRGPAGPPLNGAFRQGAGPAPALLRGVGNNQSQGGSQ